MKHCTECGGAVADAGEVTMWAGKWCRCAYPKITQPTPCIDPATEKAVEDMRKKLSFANIAERKKLRAQFAGQFLSAMIINNDSPIDVKGAVAWADALIEELEKAE